MELAGIVTKSAHFYMFTMKREFPSANSTKTTNSVAEGMSANLDT